jgi:hypothetical protein
MVLDYRHPALAGTIVTAAGSSGPLVPAPIFTRHTSICDVSEDDRHWAADVAVGWPPQCAIGGLPGRLLHYLCRLPAQPRHPHGSHGAHWLSEAHALGPSLGTTGRRADRGPCLQDEPLG